MSAVWLEMGRDISMKLVRHSYDVWAGSANARETAFSLDFSHSAMAKVALCSLDRFYRGRENRACTGRGCPACSGGRKVSWWRSGIREVGTVAAQFMVPGLLLLGVGALLLVLR